MSVNNGYYQISIYDLFEETKPKRLTIDEIVSFINKKYLESNLIKNDIIYNIVITRYFSQTWNYAFFLEEEYEDFLSYYTSFENVFISEKVHIFKLCGYYYISYINDFIVQVCNDGHKLYAPCCSISWYNSDGTFTNDYMLLKDGESITTNVRLYGTKKLEYQYNFSENRKDRRNYYFFNLLNIHKYGKYREGLEDLMFDTFASFEFSLEDLINYFRS